MARSAKKRLGWGMAAVGVSGAALAWVPVPGFLSFEQVTPASVDVRSTNGALYNDLVRGSQVQVKVAGACEINEKQNSHPVEALRIVANAWPTEVSDYYLEHLDHFAYQLPEMELGYPDGIYPQGVAYPSAWRDRAIAACNTHLNYQIDTKGLTKNQVLSKQWDLNNVPLDGLQATMVCGSAKSGGGFTDPPYLEEKTVAATMNVRCLKYSLDQVQATPKDPVKPGATDDVTLKVGVTQAALSMVPDEFEGACPAQLNASATIVTNGPTRVRYRLENDKGQLSPVGYIDVDQTKTAYVSIKVPVGKAQSQPSPQNTYGVATPMGGGTGAVNTVSSTAPPANVYQGFYRLLTLAPNEVTSQPSSFKVTCKAAIKQQLVVPPQPPVPPKPTQTLVAPQSTTVPVKPIPQPSRPQQPQEQTSKKKPPEKTAEGAPKTQSR